jgi:hypothetical protein
MLCDRESLLTNLTRLPAATWMLRGLAPLAVIVIVVVWTGGEFEGGLVGEPLLPQAAIPRASDRPNA